MASEVIIGYISVQAATLGILFFLVIVLPIMFLIYHLSGKKQKLNIPEEVKKQVYEIENKNQKIRDRWKRKYENGKRIEEEIERTPRESPDSNFGSKLQETDVDVPHRMENDGSSKIIKPRKRIKRIIRRRR